MTWEQLCLFCWGTGISIEHSYPAEGPSYYSMGEPAVLEPCICQYDPYDPGPHDHLYNERCDCPGCDH